jgi:hypothetical protein
MPLVLPLKMVAFQSLLLLVAIAIEAAILRKELLLPPKQSVQYATIINYFSTTVGWILFLSIQNFLPELLKLQLISFIFFDRWSTNLRVWIILAALVTFFASFFIKLMSLIQLRAFLGDQEKTQTEELPKPLKFGSSRRISESDSALARQGNAVLKANAFSYTAISLILVTRFLVQGSITLPHP